MARRLRKDRVVVGMRKGGKWPNNNVCNASEIICVYWLAAEQAMRESLRCGLLAGGLCNNLSSELWNKRTGFPSAYTARVRLTSDSRHSASFTHLVVPRPPRLLPQRRIVQTPSPGACRAAFVDMVISKMDNSNLEKA
jgi:hypothetical protein